MGSKGFCISQKTSNEVNNRVRRFLTSVFMLLILVIGFNDLFIGKVYRDIYDSDSIANGYFFLFSIYHFLAFLSNRFNKKASFCKKNCRFSSLALFLSFFSWRNLLIFLSSGLIVTPFWFTVWFTAL